MRLLIPLLPLLLLAGGCDRQSAQAPQAAPRGGELTGRLDISLRGSAAPDAVFESPAGDPVTLGDFRGRPVLLNLWATWCAPCVAEMPTLDRLAERSAGRLHVLTVSQDVTGAAVVDPFFRRAAYHRLEPWLDRDGALGQAIGSGRLPTTVLYDAEGREVWRIVGGLDWEGPRANTLLAGILDANRATGR